LNQCPLLLPPKTLPQNSSRSIRFLQATTLEISASRASRSHTFKMDEIVGGAKYVIENIQYFALNFLHNVENVLDMDLRTAIRLVVIVGAYLLIRPYLVKGGAKLQEKQHEKVFEADKKREKEALISANSLRGQVEVPEDTESEEEGQASGVNWGGKARKKQRKAIKKILEVDEKMRLDAEGDKDDKDIMDLLVDYEEGQDGW